MFLRKEKNGISRFRNIKSRSTRLDVAINVIYLLLGFL